MAQQLDFNQFQRLTALLEEQNSKISKLMDENKQLASSFTAELNKVKENFAMFKDNSTSKSKKSAKLPKSLMVCYYASVIMYILIAHVIYVRKNLLSEGTRNLQKSFYPIVHNIHIKIHHHVIK